jgi:hypothetical protein
MEFWKEGKKREKIYIFGASTAEEKGNKKRRKG